MQISKGVFDKGNVLHQIECSISQTDYYPEIEKLIAEKAAENLSFVVENIDRLRPGKPQNMLADVA